MKTARIALLGALVAALAILGSACSSVPEESVTLSVTVGKDLKEVHRAHRELALRYFQRSRGDVTRFIEEVYAPAFIRAAMEDAYEYDGKSLPILDIIAAEYARLKAGENEADPVFYMSDFVESAVATIEARRIALLAPIEAREAEVIRAIDDTYGNLHSAHAIVTGHLASLRKVQQAQDELLSDIGLKDLRRKFIDKAAELSDRAADVLAKAQKTSLQLDEAEKKLDEIRKLWSETIR